MTALLLVGAILIGLVSFLFVSEATMGVWMMAGAVLLVALARVAQAAGHQRALLAELHQSPAVNPPVETLPPPPLQ